MMGLAAYEIIGNDAEWRVRHDGKAENIYETKEAASKPRLLSSIITCTRQLTAAVWLLWIWIAGTIIMTIGVGLVHSGHEIGDPIAAVSSLLVLADMLLFGWLVFRREPVEQTSQPSTMPAE
jgi:hypothetical protein